MNLEKDEVIKLFVEYGFEFKEKASGSKYLTFTFKSGFFHNAEIVLLSQDLSDSDKEDIEKVEANYDELGFSIKKNTYGSVKEIRKKLFDGFFETKNWKKKNISNYKDFCSTALDSLPDGNKKYSYINTSYIKNDCETCENSIVDEVISQVKKQGPCLILMEAPAGFGKTCTSFEIVNRMAQEEDDSMPIPFFTEFSRDRQAVTFNHIFVREVDRSFRVKSDLVIQEVQNGRIVVVLDGFDELLHDASVKKEGVINASFESVEPMLETIGDLLIGNAKVIITSRRSAIFDSSSFAEWMQRRHENFEIIRYKINAPRLSDWLNESRLNSIKRTPLKLENLSNPVLLSYLRFVDDETFNELMAKPFEIIDIYVKSMLEREWSRQDLGMNNDDQNLFLTEIARDMSVKNYTSLSKDELVSNIKTYCGPLLEKTRANYPPGKKPTIDKLATTLSNHCFFDRGSGNTIQFVNEFIFGYYLSNCLMQSSDWVPADERFVEPAILSFQAREQEKKNIFWSKVETIKGVLDKADRMRFEQILKGCVNDNDYDESDITNVFLDSISLFESNEIKNSVFSNCKFNNCNFYFGHFYGVVFLNCVFWNCIFSQSNEGERFDIEFYNCDAPNSNFIETIETLKNENQIEENPDVKKYILNEICPLGSSLSNIHFYWPKLVSSEKFPKKQILNGLKELKNEGFLEDAHDHDFMKINTSKYGDIKRMLGRI